MNLARCDSQSDRLVDQIMISTGHYDPKWNERIALPEVDDRVPRGLLFLCHRPLPHIMSSSSSLTAPFFFSSWMFRPSPRISLQRTSKLTGVPASSVLVPFTMLS